VYNAPQLLMPPTIMRQKSGDIVITAVDKESAIYYTIDGTKPGAASRTYTAPIATDGKKIAVKAIAYESSNKKSSAVAEESFDVAKTNWVVLGTTDRRAAEAIDGNAATAWLQERNVKMPLDVVIDLGKSEALVGFRYLPSQSRNVGIITHYQFYTSTDNETWKLTDEGEFSNIQNNPLWQTKRFVAVSARYIKLRALKNTLGNDAAGFAEIDMITK